MISPADSYGRFSAWQASKPSVIRFCPSVCLSRLSFHQSRLHHAQVQRLEEGTIPWHSQPGMGRTCDGHLQSIFQDRPMSVFMFLLLFMIKSSQMPQSRRSGHMEPLHGIPRAHQLSVFCCKFTPSFTISALINYFESKLKTSWHFSFIGLPTYFSRRGPFLERKLGNHYSI